MLGIFLIYWVGKKYYELAFEYNKSMWGWAIGAVLIYYGSQFLFGMLIGVFIGDSVFYDSSYRILISVLGILVGLLVWYLVYKYLANKWYIEYQETLPNEIEEIGKGHA